MISNYTPDEHIFPAPGETPAPGPYVATGWKNLVVNDENGDTIALAPGAHLSVERAAATARLIAASWEMRETLTEIYQEALRAAGFLPPRLWELIVMAEHALRTRKVYTSNCPPKSLKEHMDG